MANTKLIRTPSSASNRKKFTISMWFRIGRHPFTDGAGGDSRELIGQTSSSYFRCLIQSSGTMRIYDQSGFNYITNRKLKDKAAWYNIVIRADTTQSTANDRVRVYLNGVDERTVGGYSTDSKPSQNQDFAWNITAVHQVGGHSNNYDYFSGVMSDVVQVDGQSLAPTSFGETDPDTGEWRIKDLTSSSFTWGTNGFMILHNGGTITDQSSNSNNWTLQSGAITNTKDCPSNLFATWNDLSTVSYKQSSGANLTISNGNTTILENGGQYKNVPSTIGAFTGKYYFETKIISPVGSLQYSTYVGVITANAQANVGNNYNHVGQTANSVGYNSYTGQVFTSDSATSYGASLANGDILGVALDVTNLKVYFSKNGTFQNSGNPASGSTGTGAVSLPSTGDSWHFGGSPTNNSIQSNFGNGFFGTTAITTNSGNGYAGAEGASKFNYAVPSGYSALSTKGLNL